MTANQGVGKHPFYVTVQAPPRSGDAIACDWQSFALVADEWFSAYLVLSNPIGKDLASPLLFAGGHALEMYLKAAYARNNGVAAAISKGHNLQALWNYSASLPGFPLKLKLREHLLRDGELIFGLMSEGSLVKPEDRNHLLRHRSLYRVISSVMDLKYVGSSMKGLPFGLRQGFIYETPDRYLIALLASIYDWLGLHAGLSPLLEAVKFNITPASVEGLCNTNL
jgi:hypothetical protein